MSVLLDTSAGEIVIDLFTSECPVACENFLKLCKIKYYNGCLFYNIQSNYIAQSGDPTGTGHGGQSIYSIIKKDPSLCFIDEIVKSRKMNKIGLVCMANEKENANKSQFFITLRSEDLTHLQGKHTIVGEVAEGYEVLEILNNLYCDEDGRPYQDVRIKHTYILDDPYPDSIELLPLIPPNSPTYTIPPSEQVKARISYEDDVTTDEYHGKTEAEIEANIKRKEAHSRALVLEMAGDIPDADVKPPVEVLFICKLNPVTTDADLELIFSRFGTIKDCSIIRDTKTGESLNYAFIEYETEEACLEAYEKMNNVLIDDRRIKVDFSQSVSKLWNKFLLQPRKAMKKDKLHTLEKYEQKQQQQQQQQQNKMTPYNPRHQPQQQKYQQQQQQQLQQSGKTYTSNIQQSMSKDDNNYRYQSHQTSVLSTNSPSTKYHNSSSSSSSSSHSYSKSRDKYSENTDKRSKYDLNESKYEKEGRNDRNERDYNTSNYRSNAEKDRYYEREKSNERGGRDRGSERSRERDREKEYSHIDKRIKYSSEHSEHRRSKYGDDDDDDDRYRDNHDNRNYDNKQRKNKR